MNDSQDPTFSETPLNADITTCISQLAERAEELGEVSTAVVLFSLAGHRVVKADRVLAIVAAAQAQALKDHIDKSENQNNG